MATHPGRRSWLSRAADLVWPPRSLLSDHVVDRPGAIEASLWAQLPFLTPPLCACCGTPFETEEDALSLCGACLAGAPAFTTARAALRYDDHARRLVLDLKRGGRRDGLPVFAAWMAAAGGDALTRADLITPTPLHWTRLVERRFNQSAWLAQALGRRLGKPVAVDLITRRKRRRSQGGLSADQRRRNVQGVFAVPKDRAHRIAGRSVALVDDVFTTGATAEACARALRRAGAQEVHVLTLARVVRPLDVL